MQLRLDAADRLVELVEERRGPVYAEEAARRLFALRHVPAGMARSLLEDAVAADARLAWSGDSVRLATPPGHDLPLERATYVVVDLETTGLRPGVCRICEIGAVRVRELELGETFHTLVDPGVPLGALVASLTGLRDGELRLAPPAAHAVRRFLDFAADAVLVAHNARFDLAFLDRETERLTGRRLAGPVVDTVSLARRVLAGRISRAGLASLAHFFGTSARPCHRALPDATATAEILVALIGLAQERGATSVADLCELASTRTRRIYLKRSLAFGAPTCPGIYLFRDAHDQVLYVGRARDLRARLRSYFRTDRQRPAVEAALAALERIEWRECGSELEAALEELRLIRELRPPANARVSRPDRYVYLRRRGQALVCSSTPTELGPIRSRSSARLAARLLDGASDEELGAPELALPRLRAKVRERAEALRYEDAARLRDRVAALERIVAELRRLRRLRRAACCLVVPALEPGFARAVFVAGGRIVTVRSLPPGAGARLEVEAGLALCRAAEPSLDPEAADELHLVGSFLRRPPPELRVCPLDAERILAAATRAAALGPARPTPARTPARRRAA
ncbi:MAG TPA: exonuclease domain-containing protein [Gaiellaceae bacterium]|jgi:DNA polymerase-3 subunit epsilon|nr:exonuclease domain-containing protein [Gaiellaceae bacterium]